jgi:tRNA 2-selenouridine synthase
MRSEKFAAFLNEHGFETHTLDKGYKAYRNFVLRTFTGDYNFILLGGETGSGKTDILKKMIEKGAGVVDLEGLAQHKGSAFGSLGESAQPSQEQFENNLANELLRLSSGSDIIWLEDESRSIGTCQLPNPIWDKMKAAPIVRVNIPHEARIERLLNDYGNFPKESLGSSILRIKKRLGPQHAKSAMEALEAGNLRAVTELVLTYYDKAYNHCHELRNYRDIHVVECASADAAKNADQVLEFTRHQLTQPNA